MTNQNEQQIKDMLKAEIREITKEYLDRIEKYKNALEALGEPVTIRELRELIGTEEPKDTIERNIRPSFKSKKHLTVRQKITSVLQFLNRPLTSREIMDAINRYYPEREYDFASFSGNFSLSWRKAGVKKFELEGAPIEWSTVYALPEWVGDDGELLPEYKAQVSFA